jgi:hypothetical protein
MSGLKSGVCTVIICSLFLLSALLLASPPDTNNAAVLYYQAFLSLPDKDKLPDKNKLSLPLEPLPSGRIEPNEATRRRTTDSSCV